MIFDMRLRPPFGSWLKSHIYAFDGYYPSHVGFTRPASVVNRSMDLLIEEMDAAGITKGLIPGRRSGLFGDIDNADLLELTRLYPDRFYALWGLRADDPHESAGEIPTAMKHASIVGVSLEPTLAAGGPLAIDDRSLDPIYETASDLGAPVSLSMSAQIGPDISYSNPIPVQRIATRFPKLRIIVSHGAWPWAREVAAIAFICPNVYVSPDQYLNTPNMPGSEAYVQSANYFLDSRLLFGSSYPSRPLEESVRGFRTWPIPPVTQQKILYENALELFGISP